MPATEGRGMTMKFGDVTYSLGNLTDSLLNLNESVKECTESLDRFSELTKPLEITCKVDTELNSLEYLMPQQESMFNFCFSDRQKKRRRRHLRRNKPRSNGTRRNKSLRVHNRPLVDFNAIAIDVKMSGDGSTMTFKKVKGKKFKL